MSDRPHVRLGEVARVRSGFAFKSSEWTTTGVPVVKISNVKSGSLVMDGCSYVSQASASRAPKEFNLSERDILIAMTGYIGDVARTKATDLPAVLNQRVGKFFNVASDRLDDDYLYSFLSWSDTKSSIAAMGYGSAQPNVSPSLIEDILIPLPPIHEQRAIAHILGTLDDKIELNRRMAATLEEMARAIFKSWFIDFDPVRAKVEARRNPGSVGTEGRPTNLPPEIDALFPDSFENSALGNIPSGWEVTMLTDVLAELEVGSRPKGGVGAYTSGIPSIGAESIVGLGIFDYSKTKYVPLEFFERMTRGQIMSRDVLLYKDGGRPGEFEPHVTMFGDGFPFETAAINEHVYRLRAKPHLGQEFLFFWLSSPLIMEEMRVKGTGVAIPGLNSTQVRSLTTLVPAPAVIDAFARYVEPCVARLLAACKDSRTLATMRDALLPKLIAGEIRVPEEVSACQ